MTQIIRSLAIHYVYLHTTTESPLAQLIKHLRYQTVTIHQTVMISTPFGDTESPI